METLLKEVTTPKMKPENADDLWNEAAQKHGNKSVNSEVIPLEEARKYLMLPAPSPAQGATCEARKLGIISDGK